MARVQRSTLRSTLKGVLPDDLIRERAQAFGVVRRTRKVDIVALVWALALGFQTGAERSIEGLRHAYLRVAGVRVVRSSFYDRLTRGLARLLRALALDAMETLGRASQAPKGYLTGFRELLTLDATVLRLRELLTKDYAACRTNHTKSAAKLHMVMNVLDGSPRRVRVTGERMDDRAPWRRLGRWVEGSLLLIDLGYYSFQLFDRIRQNGGFFLSRMKSNANPLIVADHGKTRRRSIQTVGKRLQEVLPALKRQYLDVEVEVSFKRRETKGQRSTVTKRFCLVAVYDQETRRYHGYFTNVPPARLAPEDVTYTHALRWQVEILFKAMKSHGHLAQLPSKRRHVVECLVWASVLALIASQALFRLVRQAVPRQRYVPLLRWAALPGRVAQDLLRVVLLHDHATDRYLLELLLDEAQDPNRRRPNRALEYIWCPPAP